MDLQFLGVDWKIPVNPNPQPINYKVKAPRYKLASKPHENCFVVLYLPYAIDYTKLCASS